MDIRNVAIIAHVDHGKTTLVDGLLKQSHTFRENEAEMQQELIMDSNDQERERGITILAKNTAVEYKGTKINIIDTPGHADFGGEVERTLNMADGALLIVDAAEGPMPQTKFVLKKALEIGLKVIVVINKIDKQNADINKTLNETETLFLDLATNEEQLHFPVLYAIGREGKAWTQMPEDTNTEADLSPLFEEVLKSVPQPQKEEGEFQMLVTSLTWDSFKGKYALGKIKRGNIKKGDEIVLLSESKQEKSRIENIYVTQGLNKIEVDTAEAGDIVALTGIANAKIGDTLAAASNPEALPILTIEDPTLKVAMGPNTSPLAGQDGKFVTSRQILDRIHKELETNIAMKLEIPQDGSYLISGRGELHISVFLETLRREGYEVQVGKPQVITKIIDGKECEPVEELTIDVSPEFVGGIASEVGKRRGIMKEQKPISTDTTRLVYEIPTRGLLGLRTNLISLSKGTAVVNTIFLRFEPVGNEIPKLRNGVLIASETGESSTYGLNNAQERGVMFIGPSEKVYMGMIVGLNARQQDLEVNVSKTKHATNVRSGGLKDEGIILTPPLRMSLEQCLNFIEEDELVEITPKNIRLRKRLLDPNQRKRASK